MKILTIDRVHTTLVYNITNILHLDRDTSLEISKQNNLILIKKAYLYYLLNLSNIIIIFTITYTFFQKKKKILFLPRYRK